MLRAVTLRTHRDPRTQALPLWISSWFIYSADILNFSSDLIILPRLALSLFLVKSQLIASFDALRYSTDYTRSPTRCLFDFVSQRFISRAMWERNADDPSRTLACSYTYSLISSEAWLLMVSPVPAILDRHYLSLLVTTY